ncbi:Na(+)-translocating NADH-quinone reductase subunit A [Flavobacterium cellulosilyticum]|uniref:Na(+)-translocating NADH-quinone reductase subunit A n=1 Tax=Flavobacterium cellulosilyticum TaxID=2541731 RepID=A0A4R5C9A1_9FLAO|nr:Na(+)-translocating NADH-quinone reductase subunit A [Flavobacterium cellulosilyticum]TDD94733.1 Na(+)-translocating NADH-quinone reductase subunit A [Flavobacterium cellulosilyticum]
MSLFIEIKRGLNLKLIGEAEKTIQDLPIADVFAIKPNDFTGLHPKLLVKVGDTVLAGTPLFYNKNNEAIIVSSPVSGEVIEILRGDKRVILEIKILADREIKYASFPKSKPNDLNREEIIEKLLNSGAWPFIRQRPYGCIANPSENPKSIFISAFDSSPLAPDNDFIMSGKEIDFQTGLDVLKKLTDGKIHLNVQHKTTPASIFSNAKSVQINKISGPHPAGNIGVQIHHIDPINKGEAVWCINPQDVLILGKLFNEGLFDATRTIALTGSQVNTPKYYKTIVGCSIKNILADGGLKKEENRIISGTILTGSKIPEDGFLGFYDSQITVIPEGNHSEFMGWLTPGLNKFSLSRTFFSWLTPNKKYDMDTNLHGEERPFVMTGEYEKVFPMDIYPVQLLKSILIEDIDMMEKLGIYEVVEEDFALCELVCTSKIKSQEIIRQGLDIIRKEFS